MKRFNEHFYNTKTALKTKAEGMESMQSKIDPIGSHFSMPDHDKDDIQISVLAFIILTPESKEALALRLKVEKNGST